MSEEKIHHLGIDCTTKGKAMLMRRLRALDTTISVTDGGEYHQDRSLSQVHLEATMTESELDTWLYRNGMLEYIGTFERFPEPAEPAP